MNVFSSQQIKTYQLGVNYIKMSTQPPNFIVRRAKEEDAQQIAELANSVKLNTKAPQQGGFLIYITDEEAYKNEIEKSKFFYVADAGGKIIGFSSNFDNTTLDKLVKEGSFADEKQLIDFLSKQKKPFLLGAQIAINPDYAHQGIGKQMIDKLFEDLLENSITEIYTTTSHKPVRNVAMINFITLIGFKFLFEVTNPDNNTWGIYKIGREKE